MAGTGVGKFSSTASSNTANMTVNFAENMAPSNVNNAARELMGHMRDMYEQLGDGYFEFGDGDGTYTVARGDADTITITSSADISGIYFAGRKIRITDGGANVVEGTIASSSHSSTTQTVNLTGISLASGTPTKVELGIDTAAFGGRVILDDDGDTYIEAPTDDTIDIYVAGAKDFVITANTFTAESGSTIAAQALTATTVTASGVVDVTDTTDSSDATGDTGALRTEGGASIAKKLFVGTDLDVDGTANLDVVDIDGAVDMASTLQVDGAITSSAGATITVADNSDALTLKTTDADSNVGPVLLFNRDSSSPANNDFLGELTFQGDNNAGETHDYIRMFARILNVADGSEQADFIMKDATGTNIVNMAHTEVVFNDDSVDRDFRVESNGNANMIFVDAGNDKVGIGTNAPADALHIKAGTGIIRLHEASQADTKYGEIESSNGRLFFHSDRGAAESDSDMRFHIDNDEKVRIHTGGQMSVPAGIELGSGLDATAANVLDDYEEGTYTPTFTVASGSLTVHGSHNTLAYTKIGRVVHVQGEVRFSAVSSPSGNFSISLPFAVADLGEGAARFMSSPIGQSGFGGTPDGTLFAKNTNEGTTTIAIQTSVSSSGNDANVNANQVSTSTEFIFAFTFIAA